MLIVINMAPCILERLVGPCDFVFDRQDWAFAFIYTLLNLCLLCW